MTGRWFAALPSKQERSRISLDFGLARAGRSLRERVVPGLGRIWFVRQLSWPVAALALRDELRGVVNVKASAISQGLEALGCKLEWSHDPGGDRILGKRAFGRDGDGVWDFGRLRRTKHYVQNTHRQAASRALRDAGGLGLATGARFDMLELTSPGGQLADAFLDQFVGKGRGSLRTRLTSWLRGDSLDVSKTVRDALTPASASAGERARVRERVFGTATDACSRRVHAARALGIAREPRSMPEVALRLREEGYVAHADDVVVAHSFGVMIDRARDLAAVVSRRVDEAKLGWPLAAASADKDVKQAVAATRAAGASYRDKAAVAKFDDGRARAFARVLDLDVAAVVTAVARAAPEVLAVADGRMLPGPLFRLVESSEAMRMVELEEGADTLEPDGTEQTFRLANLHALARDLEGKPG